MIFPKAQGEGARTGGGGLSAPPVPSQQSKLTAPLGKTALRAPTPGQVNRKKKKHKLSFLRPGPASPHWQPFPPIRTDTAPKPACRALIGLDGSPGPRVTNLGAPLLHRTRAPRCFPWRPSPPRTSRVPSPTPRALAATYRPGRCPLAGPASRASGPAPTWRRRSERAGGRLSGRGWGAERALAGGGTRGRGGGDAALSRWPPRPRGLRVGRRRGRGSVRAALLTTAWTRKVAAPSRASPRVLALRQVPETGATRA